MLLPRSGRSGAADKAKTPGPIKDAHLMKLLQYLFPDSKSGAEFPYPDDLSKQGSSSSKYSESFQSFRVAMSGIKSSPVDGLIWRLTVLIAHCLYILGETCTSQKPVFYCVFSLWLVAWESIFNL